MGEYAELERQFEEDPLRETGEEFAEMGERIEEYFSNVSDEQLMKDLKKAGYKGKLGPDDSDYWFVIGICIGVVMVPLWHFGGKLVVWIINIPL